MNLDAHQHFWKYNPEEYGWIDDEMSILKKDFLPQDLLPSLQKSDMNGTIAVEARQTLEETRWLLALSDAFDFIRGVVGWVDLRSDDLVNQLQVFTRHPRFCGVRHVIQDEPDDRFMLKEDFLRGIRHLKKYNLVYDVLIFEKHLPYTIELVRQFPDQRFVVDHIAKPLIKDHILQPWEKNIRKLAEFPNVFCKVSGMVTEADWHQWKPADLKSYLDVVFETFAAERIMIGSDWPVCLLCGEYSEVIGVVREYIQSLSQNEIKRVMGDTAMEVYGIE